MRKLIYRSLQSYRQVTRARRLVALGIALSTLGLGSVLLWVTNVIPVLVNEAVTRWNGLIAWLHEPTTWQHVVALVGALAIPVIVIIVIMAIIDG